MIRKVLIITLLMIGAVGVNAQRPEAGIFAGASFYNGDINPGQPFGPSNTGYGFVYRHNLDTRLALKANVFRGGLESDEELYAVRPFRDARFSATVTDVALTAEFNFLDFFIGSTKNKFSPYIFGGAGYYFYSGDYSAAGIENSYSSSGFALPFGIGAKYSLTKTLGLAFEWGYRKTFDDNVDGLQEYYPVEEGNALYGVQMSNAVTNDWYSFAGISLTLDLSIFKREVCENQPRN